MKEVTEWDNNPRMMWVWDLDLADRVKMKVIWISKFKKSFPVFALNSTDDGRVFMHCAEIEDVEEAPKLMTNKQLARWLRKRYNREWKYEDGYDVWNTYSYNADNADMPVCATMLVREGDEDWKKPTADLLEETNV